METMPRGIGTEFDTEDPPEAPEDEPVPERWGWATHPESEFWSGAGSRQAAIDAARAEAGPGADVWVQGGVMAEATAHLPTADQIIDWMDDNAADSGCPDEVDEAFDVADGGEKVLEELLRGWALKYVKANWWEPVGTPERIPGEPVRGGLLNPMSLPDIIVSDTEKDPP
jgi:hypothetical protein